MYDGQSKPTRRAPAGASPHRAGVAAALLVVLGVLLVLLLTRGDRAPERRDLVTGRVTSAPHATAPAGAETHGSDGRDDAPPSAIARSDTERGLASGGIGDGSPRRHRRRPSGDEGAPAGGVGSASPGQPGAVASEVGAQHETLGEDEDVDSGNGQQTADVEAPALDPLDFASEPEKQYDTRSETDAGKLKGLTGAGGTISFWLQPAWDGTSQDEASLLRIGDDRVRLYKSATSLRFEVTDVDGQPIAVDMPIRDWTPGDWHHLLTTWDSRNAPHVISFFVDGNLVGQGQYEGGIELPDDPKLYVGTNTPDQRVARGVVANVKVQNRPLSLADVSRRFEESKPTQR